MSSGSSRCTGPNRSCCASRNASRTIEGMVAALTICRPILVSGAMVETMSTTWNSACLWLKIPFWPVIITIGMAPSSAKAAPVVRFNAAWTQGREADARLAGQPPVGRRHEGCGLLVPGHDQLDSGGGHGFDDGGGFFPGDTKKLCCP